MKSKTFFITGRLLEFDSGSCFDFVAINIEIVILLREFLSLGH